MWSTLSSSVARRHALGATFGAMVLALASAPSPSAQPAASTAPVTLRFEATVGDEPFACGRTYTGIGRTSSSMRVVDFRFYVSRVRLVSADGRETPLTLEQDGLWQHQDVALLDFEDASGACANGGTPDVRAQITGTVPAGDYTGVRFDLGLPFEKNHADAILAPSPLNLSRLFWSWNGGYKYARIDIMSTGQPQGWMFHLGASDCSPAGPPHAPATNCAHENRPAIALSPFEAARDVIRLDLRTLYAAADIDANQEKTARGCMSSQADAECDPLFAALGLPFGDRPASRQTVFTVRPTATARASR